MMIDGNRRWARQLGLESPADGHRAGAAKMREFLGWCDDIGVRVVSLYLLSSDNLRKRDSKEIAELHASGIRLRVIGERERLGEDLVRLITAAEARTADNTKLNLTVALSYGGRGEIALAARRIATEVQAGRLAPEDVDEALFARYLLTAGIPDPDLVIRTSGEKRISNFLWWQSAYSELVFVDRLWPDFTKDDLLDAIREFHCRDRRYGGAR
jgi:undecaprenyl diphosphate synthase